MYTNEMQKEEAKEEKKKKKEVKREDREVKYIYIYKHIPLHQPHLYLLLFGEWFVAVEVFLAVRLNVFVEVE